VWDAIVTGAVSPRTSVVHEYDEISNVFAFRSGKYKISWGETGVSDWIPDIDYRQSTCGPLLPPSRREISRGETSRDETKHSDPLARAAALGPVQQLEAINVAAHSSSLVCTAKQPCLFDVDSDPNEEINLANTTAGMATIVQLQEQLRGIVRGRFTGGLDLAVTSQAAYCRWIEQAQWVQPFEGPGVTHPATPDDSD